MCVKADEQILLAVQFMCMCVFRFVNMIAFVCVWVWLVPLVKPSHMGSNCRLCIGKTLLQLYAHANTFGSPAILALFSIQSYVLSKYLTHVANMVLPPVFLDRLCPLSVAEVLGRFYAAFVGLYQPVLLQCYALHSLHSCNVIIFFH